MKYKIKKIDNINSNIEVDSEICKFIYNTVEASLLNNENNTYTQEDLDFEIGRKSVERVTREIKNKFLVYIEINNNIIAFGAISKKENKYEYTWLQVIPEYQNQGFANIISDIRDNYIKNLGVKEVFIQSFKFPNTIRFHKSRGFKEVGTSIAPTHIDMVKKF